MNIEAKINLLKDRKRLLLSRGKDNYKIVKKLDRKIRSLKYKGIAEMVDKWSKCSR